MTRADYKIVRANADELVIRDVGVGCMSVTNDAEAVVMELVRSGLDGRRLLYYDTEGELDELVVKDGKFAGFARGPRP